MNTKQLFQYVTAKSVFHNQGLYLFCAKTSAFYPQDLITIMKVKIYFIVREMRKQNSNDLFCLYDFLHICFKHFDHHRKNYLSRFNAIQIYARSTVCLFNERKGNFI